MSFAIGQRSTWSAGHASPSRAGARARKWGLLGAFGIAVSGGDLFVTNNNPGLGEMNGKIGVFNATTGAVVNAALVTGLDTLASGIAVSGGNLFVANPFISETIGEYNATTGAVVNAALVSGLGGPFGIAISGGDLFVANNGLDTIGEYNATTGAVVNAALVSGLDAPQFIAIQATPTPPPRLSPSPAA
jgi:hypothetical protein